MAAQLLIAGFHREVGGTICPVASGPVCPGALAGGTRSGVSRSRKWPFQGRAAFDKGRGGVRGEAPARVDGAPSARQISQGPGVSGYVMPRGTELRMAGSACLVHSFLPPALLALLVLCTADINGIGLFQNRVKAISLRRLSAAPVIVSVAPHRSYLHQGLGAQNTHMNTDPGTHSFYPPVTHAALLFIILVSNQGTTDLARIKVQFRRLQEPCPCDRPPRHLGPGIAPPRYISPQDSKPSRRLSTPTRFLTPCPLQQACGERLPRLSVR